MTTSRHPGGMAGYLTPSFINTGIVTHNKVLSWAVECTSVHDRLQCLLMYCLSGFSPPPLFYRPDLVDMSRVSTQTNRSNLDHAFGVAEHLGVARLLDPEGKIHTHYHVWFDSVTL